MRPTPPHRAELGRLLRQLRKEASLTQETLASRAKLTRVYVGMVERGERNASFEAVDRWLCATGTTWSDFAHQLEDLGFPREPQKSIQRPPRRSPPDGEL